MPSHTGQRGVVMVGAEVVGQLRNWQTTETTDTVETQVMGPDDWKTRKSTWRDWSGNATFYWDPSDTGQQALNTKDAVSVVLYPDGQTAGTDYQLSGSCFITERSVGAELDGMVEMPVSLTGSGPLVQQAVPV